jgi:hypothetical protein
MHRYRVVYSYLDGLMGTCYVNANSWLDAQRVAYQQIARSERVSRHCITIMSAALAA